MTVGGYLSHLLSKWRYSPPRRLLLDALARCGLRLTCYYLVEEGAEREALSGLDRGFEEYRVALLAEEDMGPLATLPGRRSTREELIGRLRRGHFCLAAKHGPELAAVAWCSTREAAFMGKRSILTPREAYLYDTYTLPAHRGRGVAVFLRCRLYRFLAARGHDRLYSISGCANSSSIRFKAKLHARFHGPYLYIGLGKRWHWHGRLKVLAGKPPTPSASASFPSGPFFSDLP